jgi:hypothetical protein
LAGRLCGIAQAGRDLLLGMLNLGAPAFGKLRVGVQQVIAQIDARAV